MKKHWLGILVILISGVGHAELPPVAISPVGCSMAHCNAQMQDQTKLPAPDESSVLYYPKLSDGTQRNDGGAVVGLGCTSNGVDRFACAYANENVTGGPANALVVYDRDANPIWKSGSLLNVFTAGSAPLIDQSGIVFGADSEKLVRVNTVTNEVRTADFLTRYMPFSPIPVADGGVFIAGKGLTSAPPIVLVDSRTMTVAATKVLRLYPGDAGFFETANTPTARPDGRRAYVLTRYVNARREATNRGRLYAMNVELNHPNPELRLTVAWYYEFVAPSGASPTYVDGKIFFDAQFVTLLGEKTHVTAVRDNGGTGTLEWKKPLVSNVQASFAIDPRGGLWVYPFTTPYLLRYSTDDGQLLQTIDVNELLNVPGISVPSSALTIHGDASDPVLMVGAADRQALEVTRLPENGITASEAYRIGRAIQYPTYVLAIGLLPAAGTLRASAKIGDSIATLAPGQFAAIPRNGKTAAVFSTLAAGPYLLTAP